jgi:hypothetical protein
MATFFDRFAAVADHVADATFGERLLIEPQVQGGYTGKLAADPDRPAITVIGVFTARPVEDTLSGQAAGEARVRGLEGVVVRRTAIKLSTAVVMEIGYDLRENDRITRLDRTVDNVFAVVDSVPADLGDLLVHVVTA